MQIQLQQIAKRYNNHWVLKNVNLEFTSNNKIALLGINGSGKSTLLQIIAGYVLPSFGKIYYCINDKMIEADKIFKHIGYCAPAMELIEEFTISEFLNFHHQYKSLSLSVPETIAYIGLQESANKKIENCSSGMKQRIKLAQSIMTQMPILLLDEPCSNLDANGIELYQKMIADFADKKLVIVSSNDTQEYQCCNTQINTNQFK
jgi:ABC-2 type transport system ATP-binding protein